MKKLLLTLIFVLLASTVQAGSLLPYPLFQAIDGNGDPIRGGLLYTYAAGTTTNKATYSDQACTSANTNPVVLDSEGRAEIWLCGEYKLNLKTSAGGQVPGWPVDNVEGMNASPTLGVSLNDTYDCNLGDAITGIGATVTRLICDCTSTLTDGDTDTIPATTTFVPVDGCSLVGVAGGGTETVNINGALEAAEFDWIGSNITISGTPKTDTIYTDWFGTTITDINLAIVWASAAGIGNVQLGNRTYTDDTAILLKNGVTIKGAKKGHQGISDGTIIQTGATANYAIYTATATKAVGIEDLKIDMSGMKAGAYGVFIEGTWHAHTKGITITDAPATAIGLGIYANTASNLWSSHEDWEISGDATNGTGVKIWDSGGAPTNTSTIFKNFDVSRHNINYDIDSVGSGMVFIDCGSQNSVSHGVDLATVASGSTLTWIGGEISSSGGWDVNITANTRAKFINTTMTGAGSGTVNFASATFPRVIWEKQGSILPGLSIRDDEDGISFQIIPDNTGNAVSVTHGKAANVTITWEGTTNDFYHNWGAGLFKNYGKTVQTLTYGATVAVDASLGNVCELTVTDGVAFTISDPTNRIPGQELIFIIYNNSGGAMGAITWGTNRLKVGAWTNPANTKRRAITFTANSDGTVYYQTGGNNGDM